MAGITRDRRTDSDDIPVTVYFRDPTIRRVYCYPDSPRPWLYDGETDRPLAQFDSITALESALADHL